MDAFWVSYEGKPPKPMRMSPTAFVGELASAFYRDQKFSFVSLGKITLSGNVIMADVKLSELTTSVNDPIVLSPPPPPSLQPPSLGEKYVDRTCASCEEVIAAVDVDVTAFVGPKGSGKSRTLIEVFHLANSQGKNAIYLNMRMVSQDMDYANCDGRFYFFVDNAQLLWKQNWPSVCKMLSQGKVCLAFSSNISCKDGLSYLNCPLDVKRIFDFVPFTQSELKEYIKQNCSAGKSYYHPVTLPSVVEACLLHELPYDKVVNSYLIHITDKILTGMGDEGGADIFKYLYSFFHLNEELELTGITRLVSCGLLYYKDGALEFVLDKTLVFNHLISIAKIHHDLFAKYDIGGAEELKFSDCCRKGPIQVHCRGSGRTINGRSPKEQTLRIHCKVFKEQSTIGANVEVDLSSSTCVLIKLARNHPAIDFIIVRSEGSVHSKKLYFIQVSSSEYQQRPRERKLEAVNTKFSTLRDQTPYNYYKTMFQISNSEIYYIYSTICDIPLNSSFSTVKKEKDSVYFHQLSI